MTATTVVFDLDGTLIDTAPDLINAANHVLAGAGLGAVPGAVLQPFISFGSRRMIEEGLAFHGHKLPAAEIDRMWHAFLATYADNIAVDSRPYPHLENVLGEIARSGARLAVCTNKPESLSRKLLDALGLSDRFAAICGRDTFAVCKPHPDHLRLTIERAGGKATHAIMVGDSDTDVATAKAAGIPIIGVGFGYSDVPMRELRPDALIEDYTAFAGAMARLERAFDRA